MKKFHKFLLPPYSDLNTAFQEPMRVYPSSGWESEGERIRGWDQKGLYLHTEDGT